MIMTDDHEKRRIKIYQFFLKSFRNSIKNNQTIMRLTSHFQLEQMTEIIAVLIHF